MQEMLSTCLQNPQHVLQLETLNVNVTFVFIFHKVPFSQGPLTGLPLSFQPHLRQQMALSVFFSFLANLKSHYIGSLDKKVLNKVYKKQSSLRDFLTGFWITCVSIILLCLKHKFIMLTSKKLMLGYKLMKDITTH